MAITEVTRKHLFADIRASGYLLWGDVSPLEFLSALYDLKNLPSSDTRFNNAFGEFSKKHIDMEAEEIGSAFDSPVITSEALDELYYGILDDPRFELLDGHDSTLLQFLCRTIHPLVRYRATEIEKMLQIYNEHLQHDGFQIYEKSRISGKPVFAARNVGASGIPNLSVTKKLLGNDSYISDQIKRIESALENGDTYSAIGTAKDLVETCCKTILKERNADESNNAKLPALVKSTCKVLSLTPDDIPNAAKAADTIKRLLSNLATVVHGIAELRNHYGSGHGKAAGTKGLQPRHAKLAVGAATTLAVFLFETHKARPTPTQESQEDGPNE